MWWQELAGLVLPAACGGCGSARTVLCPQCRAALGGAVPFRVRPVLEPPGLPAVHAAARYADEVRAVLLAHKERGALALTRPLGAALAGAVRAGVREAGEGVGVGEGPQPPEGVLLVPVPSARAAVRARGHDPARRIALAAAGELRRAGVPARVAAVLRQRRAVVDQAGLDSRQRLDNLVGALGVVSGGARVLCGGPVVLVDDLVTTGASLAEAARAVRSATAVERAQRVGRAGRAERVGRVEGGEWVEEGAAQGGGAAAAVYGGVTREDGEGGAGRADRAVEPSGAGEGGVGGVSAGVGGGGDVLCAAVVAASPGSFELNRN
ncbi:ComF family protein [Streptomyces sp. NPDC006872]|uniref:ComF family protein n=1 Tax=Streptomyces sp. NPDC006872 TaxID=3155720 RepID=UPI003408D304